VKVAGRKGVSEGMEIRKSEEECGNVRERGREGGREGLRDRREEQEREEK